MSETETGIELFNESESDIPIGKSVVIEAVDLVTEHENAEFTLLEIVYVDKEEITKLNKEHLDRDYITDILSFRYDEIHDNSSIEGTLYCCAPRIYEQSRELDETPEQEFKRILVHGLLHLVGYEDRSPSLKSAMEDREDFYLERLG